MEPRHLQSFLAVLEHRTVTDAALAEHLAPSSLSAHIRQLEAGLGVSLFTRGSAGMTLTTAGGRLADRAPALLADWEGARQAVIGGPKRLRMTGTEHIVASQIPLVLRELRRRRPDQEIDVVSLPTRAEVLTQVRSGAADAGMILDVRMQGGDWVMAGIDDQQLEFAELAPVATVLAVAPSHPLAGAGELTLAELGEHRVAVGPRVCAMHVGIERLLPTMRLDRLPSLVIARSWAVHGFAAVMLPQFAVATELTAGTLVSVPINTEPLDPWLRLAWRPAQEPHQTSAELRDLLYAASAAVAPAQLTEGSLQT